MNVPFDMIAHPGPYYSHVIVRSDGYKREYRTYVYDANGDQVETFGGLPENYVAHLNEEWERFQQELENDDEEHA